MMIFEPSPPVRALVAARMPEAPDHMRALYRAVVEEDCTYAAVVQSEGRWTMPEGRPVILQLGDDMLTSKGVRAFSGRSLRAYLPRCCAVGIVTSGPEARAYAAVAAAAVHFRKDVAIIETLPAHEG